METSIFSVFSDENDAQHWRPLVSSHPDKTEEHRNQKLLSVHKAVGNIQTSYNT